MTKTPHLIAGVFSLALAAGWSAPARADWETVSNSDRPSDRNCGVDHNAGADLKKSDNRAMRLPAGFNQEIEVYGHGIDDPGFVAKLYGTGTASRVRGVGGGVNGARGCGNIGSIVVKLNIPPDATASTPELRIGRGGDDWHARIPISIKPLRLAKAIWAPETLQGSSTLPRPAGSRARPRATPTAWTADIDQQRPGVCEPNGVGCGGSSGGVIVGLAPGGAAPGATPDLPDAIGGCLDNLGGSARISGTTLSLTFPASRAEDTALRCLRRPVIVEFETEFQRPLDTNGAYVPGFNAEAAAELTTPPVYSAPGEITGPSTVTGEPLFRTFRFTEAFITTATGTRTFQLNGSGANANTLTVEVTTGR